jgi:hypothetical protein
MFVITKKKSWTFGEVNHWLDLGVNSLWKICRLAMYFAFLRLPPLGPKGTVCLNSDIEVKVDNYGTASHLQQNSIQSMYCGTSTEPVPINFISISIL